MKSSDTRSKKASKPPAPCTKAIYAYLCVGVCTSKRRLNLYDAKNVACKAYFEGISKAKTENIGVYTQVTVPQSRRIGVTQNSFFQGLGNIALWNVLGEMVHQERLKFEII